MKEELINKLTERCYCHSYYQCHYCYIKYYVDDLIEIINSLSFNTLSPEESEKFIEEMRKTEQQEPNDFEKLTLKEFCKRQKEITKSMEEQNRNAQEELERLKDIIEN